MHLFVRTTCGVLWVLVAIVRPRPYTLSSREWRTYSTAQAAIFSLSKDEKECCIPALCKKTVSRGGPCCHAGGMENCCCLDHLPVLSQMTSAKA